MKAISKMNRKEEWAFINCLQKPKTEYFTDHTGELTTLTKDQEKSRLSPPWA